MSVVQLQLASARDADAIAVLSRDLIEAGLGWSWTSVRVRRSLDCADANVLVAKTSTSVVGFGIMRYLSFTAHLDLLAVASTHQRRGLGRRLLRWLEESVTTAGAVYVFAEARALRPGILAFYERVGYHAIERLPGYYRGEEDAVCLAKSLGHTVFPVSGPTPAGRGTSGRGHFSPPT
jgi:ribosomal-protein-alanine N-acetyltransferase